tara:strand:+ start:221 stop:466 length:246 start_codon:yes stop_codon:yes gene_type:complete
MNFRIFGENWSKYYKRGFLVAFFILTFMCIVDQTLKTPIFFSKIGNLSVLFFTLSTIFFAAVFCGMLSLIYLLIISLLSKK